LTGDNDGTAVSIAAIVLALILEHSLTTARHTVFSITPLSLNLRAAAFALTGDNDGTAVFGAFEKSAEKFISHCVSPRLIIVPGLPVIIMCAYL
jgi:hypothetical protein